MELGSEKMKSLFMLDPEVTYLNHGSFGACPKLIFEELVNWQKKLEREPVKHLAFDLFTHLEESRYALSNYINCDKDDVVFFPNPTTALNTVLKSLDLNPGDEILTTNHEYGAMDRAWHFICKKTGATYINQEISLPLNSKERFIKQFASAITNKTKVIFLSHITSPTALIFPVEEICKIAKERNIITIIDGAHAPAQISLNVKDIDADFYCGACHKWMCSPKGVSFLYAKKEMQKIIEPLVVSWGYEAENPSHSQFLDYLQWQGTNDLSAYLTIPKTIHFLESYKWNEVTQSCKDLNLWARNEICKELDLQPISNEKFNGQMTSFLFPLKDVLEDQQRFYSKYNIQIPFFKWYNTTLFRISIQAYNNKEDVDKLIYALKDFSK